MPPAIRVEKLSKRYELAAGPRFERNLQEKLLHQARTFWKRLSGSERPETRSFWALQDVSFEVQPGEVVGIVGRNGAGKSTLLKVLSRIVEPSAGRAELRGRLGSLLEVGTGFHPELSGRENVYLNGSFIGMSRHEIRRKFDEIVAFAGISEFIDTPVKRYSSGMYVRLAFAIAAHLNPEILILDEVLAVGDAQFQKKCLGKMREVSQEGRTILFVSHDMSAIRRLCNRSIVLSRGQIVDSGPTGDVVARYLASEEASSLPGESVRFEGAVRRGNGEASFQEMAWSGSPDSAGPLVSGGPLFVEVMIRSDRARTVDSMAVTILERSGVKLLNADTCIMGKVIELREGINRVRFQIRSVPLNPGRYLVSLWMAQRPAPILDYIEQACDIEVVPAAGDGRMRPLADGLICCDFDVAETFRSAF